MILTANFFYIKLNASARVFLPLIGLLMLANSEQPENFTSKHLSV